MLDGKFTHHRVCIRLQEQEKASVDAVIRSFGAWGDCTDFVMSLRFAPLPTEHSVVLDVGANIGACSALWAALQIQVVAIEPFMENFRMLRATALLRDLQNALIGDAGSRPLGRIIVHRGAAVSSYSGNVSLYDPGAGNAGTVQLQVAPTSGDRLEKKAPGLTLDNVAIAGNVLRKVHAMKLDVEGSEFGALRGASSLLSQPNIKFIYMEVSGYAMRAQGSSPLLLLRWLQRHGFEFWEFRNVIRQNRVDVISKIQLSEIE